MASGLRSDLRARAGLKNKSVDNDTKHTYTTGINNFSNYCIKVKGIKTIKGILSGDKHALVQEWIDYMDSEGKSPYTIHTYLASVCKALDMHMQEFNKPARRAGYITKGRVPNANKKGKHQEKMDIYRPTVIFSKATGWRRHELARLCLNSLDTDESGYMILRTRGKGGKIQEQRILPDDQEYIKDYFDTVRRSAIASGIPESQLGQVNIFQTAQLKNVINYHKNRRELAQKTYDYYCKIASTPEGKEKLIAEIVARWNAHHHEHPKPTKGGHHRYNEKIIWHDGRWQAADPRSSNTVDFLKKMYLNGMYNARGDNAARLQVAGLATRYERIPLKCISVFHLAHWRDNTTIENYFI